MGQFYWPDVGEKLWPLTPRDTERRLAPRTRGAPWLATVLRRPVLAYLMHNACGWELNGESMRKHLNLDEGQLGPT